MTESAGDLQRWSQVRMLIHRNYNDTMTVSLIHRTREGQRVFDRRLGMATVPLAPGDPASAEVLEALQLAVQALVDRRG